MKQVSSRSLSNAMIFGVSPLPPLKLSIATYSWSLYETLSRAYRVVGMSFTRFDSVNSLSRSDIQHSSMFYEHRAIDLYQPFSWKYAYSFYKKYLPKVVHYNVFIPAAQFPFYGLMKKARKYGSLNMVSYHNLLPHEPMPFDKHLMWKFMLMTDYFMIHTKFQEKQLVKLGFTKDKILMTPFFHVYDTVYDLRDKDFSVTRLGSKKVISFFGLIREYKGLDLLLDALPNLSDDVTVVIMGQPVGLYSARIRKKVKSLQEKGYDIRAVFEFVSDEDLVRGVLSSDIVVLPYRRFSSLSGIGKLCEVLEVPTVSTRVPGLLDLQSNIAISEPSVDSLVHALMNALKRVPRKHVDGNNRVKNAILHVESIKQRFLEEFGEKIQI